MKAPSRQALSTLCEALLPRGRVVSVRPLRGGVSSHVHAVRLEPAAGVRFDVVVRRFNEYWRREDPAVARREFKLLEILARTEIPAPKPLLLDADGSIFGAPTVVMSRLPGRALMAPRDLRDYMQQMATTLARLHAVDASELEFLHRQNKRIEGRLERPGESADPLENAIWDALRAEWPRVAASTRRGLVHADYWPGNLLWRRERLVGVVDWETPRLGDPGEDIATLRRELWLLFGPSAADEFVEYYEAAGGQYADQRLWDLWVCPEALREMTDWLPGYHILGRSDITLEHANQSVAAFARAALARS